MMGAISDQAGSFHQRLSYADVAARPALSFLVRWRDVQLNPFGRLRHIGCRELMIGLQRPHFDHGTAHHQMIRYRWSRPQKRIVATFKYQHLRARDVSMGQVLKDLDRTQQNR